MSSFRAFRKLAIEEYAAQLARRDGLLFFHHVPKTAGSSMTAELNRHRRPYENIFVQPTAEETGNRANLMHQRVEAFLAQHRETPFGSASGHLPSDCVSLLEREVTGLRMFTVLREPAARLISDYRYALTPRHPPHKAFAAEFPTIEAYVEDNRSRNKMCRFLSPLRKATPVETVRAILGRYAFIGTLETLDEDFAFLMAVTGAPAAMSARRNVTEETGRNRVEPSPELLERIRELNRLDYRLYGVVRGVLDERREAMRAFVRARGDVQDPGGVLSGQGSGAT